MHGLASGDRARLEERSGQRGERCDSRPSRKRPTLTVDEGTSQDARTVLIAHDDTPAAHARAHGAVGAASGRLAAVDDHGVACPGSSVPGEPVETAGIEPASAIA